MSEKAILYDTKYDTAKCPYIVPHIPDFVVTSKSCRSHLKVAFLYHRDTFCRYGMVWKRFGRVVKLHFCVVQQSRNRVSAELHLVGQKLAEGCTFTSVTFSVTLSV